MTARLLIASLALTLAAPHAHAISLRRVCEQLCSDTFAACGASRGCTKGLVKRCKRDGPGFCINAAACTPTTTLPPGVSTTTTLPGLPTTTSTTLPQSFVSASVTNWLQVTCDGDAAIVVTATICTHGDASGANLNPFSFEVEQSGILYGPSSCTYSLDDYCSSSISLGKNVCQTCSVAFELTVNGSTRTLRYDGPSTYEGTDTF